MLTQSWTYTETRTPIVVNSLVRAPCVATNRHGTEMGISGLPRPLYVQMASVSVLLLATLSLLLADAEAFCDHFSVDVGFLFNCQIDWGDFFPLESPPSGTGLIVVVTKIIS